MLFTTGTASFCVATRGLWRDCWWITFCSILIPMELSLDLGICSSQTMERRQMHLCQKLSDLLFHPNEWNLIILDVGNFVLFPKQKSGRKQWHCYVELTSAVQWYSHHIVLLCSTSFISLVYILPCISKKLGTVLGNILVYNPAVALYGWTFFSIASRWDRYPTLPERSKQAIEMSCHPNCVEYITCFSLCDHNRLIVQKCRYHEHSSATDIWLDILCSPIKVMRTVLRFCSQCRPDNPYMNEFDTIPALPTSAESMRTEEVEVKPRISRQKVVRNRPSRLPTELPDICATATPMVLVYSKPVLVTINNRQVSHEIRPSRPRELPLSPPPKIVYRPYRRSSSTVSLLDSPKTGVPAVTLTTPTD